MYPQCRLLELGHAICSCDALYTYTILRYGQPEDVIVAVSPISIKASLVFSAPVAPLVQVSLYVHKTNLTDIDRASGFLRLSCP